MSVRYRGPKGLNVSFDSTEDEQISGPSQMVYLDGPTAIDPDDFVENYEQKVNDIIKTHNIGIFLRFRANTKNSYYDYVYRKLKRKNYRDVVILSSVELTKKENPQGYPVKILTEEELMYQECVL